MKIGALQSAYLPWLGFFDQINQCDLFIIYDDLQYTSKDWRNRNRIKTANGPLWLAVPVLRSGLGPRRINQVEICYQENWRRRHLKSIQMSYRKAPFFSADEAFFQWVYEQEFRLLATLNRTIVDHCLARLGITTRVLYSSEACIEVDFLAGHKPVDATKRIVYLCERFGAQIFLEGSRGRNYINQEMLRDAGIILEYHDYPHPIYRQLYGEFIPYLSIIDLLFNEGANSLSILSKGGLK